MSKHSVGRKTNKGQWAWLAVLGVCACSSGTTSGGSAGSSSCPAGSETCACYGNDTCNSGLTCASHLCVNLGSAGGANGGSNSTGGTLNSTGTTVNGGTRPTGGASNLGGNGGMLGTTATGGAAATGGTTATAGTATTGGLSSALNGTGGISSTGGSSSIDLDAGDSDAGCPLGSYGCPCAWTYPATGPTQVCNSGLVCGDMPNAAGLFSVSTCCKTFACFDIATITSGTVEYDIVETPGGGSGPIATGFIYVTFSLSFPNGFSSGTSVPTFSDQSCQTIDCSSSTYYETGLSAAECQSILNNDGKTYSFCFPSGLTNCKTATVTPVGDSPPDTYNTKTCTK